MSIGSQWHKNSLQVVVIDNEEYIPMALVKADVEIRLEKRKKNILEKIPGSSRDLKLGPSDF